jgi:2,3-bisphosphoglycerate-independent phosphoglycerate mutase
VKIFMPNKQIALIILDGWGYREDSRYNAILSSKTPFFDSIWSKYSHTTLEASSLAVGLPEGQMGNSEVGHMTIGAGKVLDHDLVRIDKAISNNEFSKNNSFISLFNHIKKHNSSLHIMGLLSSGGVHSHISHLFDFIKTAKESGIKNIVIHVFTDGRDVSPQSASSYLKELEDNLEDLGVGVIASLSGRYYAMDRDNNWERLEKVEKIILRGDGNTCDINPSLFIENLYKDGIVDEQIEPVIFSDKNGDKYFVKENDGIFLFNFRADRSRMLTQKILEQSSSCNLKLVTMTDYGSSYSCEVAFPSIKIDTTLAKEISQADLSQVHIAETEKFAHATYFLNGGVENPYNNEEHILIPSRKDIPTHDLAPKMKAQEIADKAIEQIKQGTNFIFINFANPDMIGHTANVPAIIEAIEEVDYQLSRVVEELHKNNGIAIVTADHGNAEVNIDEETGKKHTAHTSNPVPFIMTNIDCILHNGTLADITPTILELFNIKKPESMTGVSLLTDVGHPQ